MDSPATPDRTSSSSSMEGLMGLLRIRVKRGINLAIRDVRTSDPYAVIKMGRQKLKTRVINKDINPVWNEDLTLSVADSKLPIMLMELSGLPSGTIISRVQPNRNNCLSDESCIMWYEGKVVQDMILRLRNVESGEVEIQLQWIDLPGSRGIRG
ncbi:hypothetical protein QQ045_029050 [Rhodiola kirilowii]